MVLCLTNLQTENFSIINGFDGTSFQRHYINQDLGDRYPLFILFIDILKFHFLPLDASFGLPFIGIPRFTFSKAHRYRLQCYYSESGILNDIFNVLRFWKSRKYLQSNMWLQSWLRRELQALIQEEDVDIIVHHIHGVVDSFFRRIEQTHLPKKTAEGKQQDFRIAVSDAAKPFLLARTERFVNELELFLASGLNIEAYDAVYMQRLGWNTPGGTSVSMPAEEPSQRTGVVPYLYIFDADSDNDQ
ncbi:hypothetical protein PTKIN_Ptkin01aG0322000 [Pterospermum kingtungense]